MIDDAEAEVDEKFSASVSNPVDVGITDWDATGIIQNDDALAQILEGGELNSSSGGRMMVGWKAVIGRTYTVLFSIDLTIWNPLSGAESITADELDKTFEHNLVPDGRGFYRIVDYFTPQGFMPVPKGDQGSSRSTR